MCVAIPMKVVEVRGEECVVAAGRTRRSASLAFLKGARKGDYLLIHAGFAIERVRPDEAEKTLRALRGIR